LIKELSILYKSNLIIIIELLRDKMISVGMSKGLTSPETIQLSEMLDILLNLLSDL
jgi:hypothetical protein